MAPSLKRTDQMEPSITSCNLGLVDYRNALSMQNRFFEERRSGAISDLLLLLEHPPTFTTGRRSAPSELPLGRDFYEDHGIEIYETDRGGRVTYHGPGQLVGYPIVSLKPFGDDVHRYIRLLEKTVISLLCKFDIEARTREGLTGVWTNGRKIASIGIHVSHGITTHGFAINASNDLEPFEWIVPCGIDGCQVTSIAKETGAVVNMGDLRTSCAESFARVFERTLQLDPGPSLVSMLTRDDKVRQTV